MSRTRPFLSPEWAFRLSLALIYVWFGALKPFDLSPAAPLVEQAVFWWDMAWFMPVLGIGEVLIGLSFLFPRFTKWMFVLVVLHMIGASLTPMLTANEVLWAQFPWVFTLEGQYIVKNLLILSGAYYLYTRSKN